ncbi:MAG: hypothetical protein M0Q26_11910 [Chitinophagaceae bacterium]|nr:hypothetical protein [Chitinophagaceae bacterium]MDP1810738.1 hypothetical protein [Sediminibacterium sp.]MDP3668028.1 hypothetical protein [Sediminibacterium sp.]
MTELKITPEKLSRLVAAAKARMKPATKTGHFAKIAVTTYSDPYKPAGENNKSETFYVYFKIENGNPVFDHIDTD